MENDQCQEKNAQEVCRKIAEMIHVGMVKL